MTLNGFLQLGIYFLVLLVLTKPLGVYMARVFSGERVFLTRVLRPVERLIYRLCHINENEEQHWTAYTAAMLMFSLAGLLVLYGLQRLQYYLPLNPQGFSGVSPDLAFVRSGSDSAGRSACTEPRTGASAGPSGA